MVERFRAKLKQDEMSIKDFLDKYMPKYKYSRFSSQINGFNDMQPETEEAIKQYLGE
jgi:hypothetical protein